MIKSKILIGAAALVVLSACQPAPSAPAKPAVDVAAETAKVKAIEAQWNDAWKARDAAKIIAEYDADAVLMTPGAPAAKGTDAITKAINGALSDKNFSLTFTNDTANVSSDGALAYTTGTFTMTMSNAKAPKGKPLADTGGYVTVYKKDAAGDWKAVADIATPEPVPAIMPAAASSAAPAKSAAPAASSAAPAASSDAPAKSAAPASSAAPAKTPG